MKAAAYLRVSTDRQDEKNQEPDVLRVCQARGWEPAIFREQESGAKVRPEWERVKLAVHRGDIGAVVVWALDRAGRDRVRLAHDIAELGRKGATVVSVREPWLDQPAGPMRDLLLQIMAWFAETERARLIERTLAGQERARAQGKHIGRNWTDAGTVQLIRLEYLAGTSAFLAAKKLGLPESTVRTYYKRWKGGFNPYPRQVVSHPDPSGPAKPPFRDSLGRGRDK
jgi:putative DNA-invertase from lambdoid prophage Rac